ncbi:MAG: aldehyde dehydrogenase family protein [Flavobacteriales bacterium]|jgi:acyl-CoA reductase-like NAD-dependent aldehyde dehydrogenase|nr:aldehyde dehydrogenase family protein [bacterium]MDG1175064.1 aldehyde dehydrogenase family protein [Flavobacteriales bacterium]
MSRIEVLKTYKMYIGGKFPRTESGRYYSLKNTKGEEIANMCTGSRKDFRNAVVEARKAFEPWSNRTAYNRSQILYRIAEMLEGRKAQFIDELMQMGSTKKQAENEVFTSIDRLIYYAGWADKYQQINSSVNPVSGPYFNFTVQEPTGVVAVIAPEENGLIGLVSTIAPIIVSGNSCIVLASESKALCSVSFAEVVNSSDVPGGVINILTGNAEELIPHFSTHKDVNSMLYCGNDKKATQLIKENSTTNLKRIVVKKDIDWMKNENESPYFITKFTEVKTTWHPIEKIGASGSGY